MDKSSRDQLTTFVERALKVERSGYMKQLQEKGGTSVTFNWTRGQGTTVTSQFPDEEAIDAMLLTARLFAQDNDRISFGKLSKLKDDAGISEGWKDRFQDARQSLNDFLDSPSLIRNEDGSSLTYREIFEVFVYGGLAHTNVGREAQYKEWQSHTLGFPMYEAEFHRAVIKLLDSVYQARLFSEMELNGDPIPPLED